MPARPLLPLALDPYSFGPVATVLDAAYTALAALADALAPLAGEWSAALVVVLVTLVVRALLVPVGVAQARAEAVRRRLAPRIAELRRRHRGSPERMQRAVTELYAAEGASPFAGCLPALAQAPVLSVVYALFALPRIAGHGNALLDAALAGVPLGRSFVGAVGGAVWPQALVIGVLLVLLALVAWASRRAILRTGDEVPRVLTWMPFVTVGVAAVVPLAAALYLLVTTTWTVIERRVLRRILHPRPADAE